MSHSTRFAILFDTTHREEITLNEPELSQLPVLLEKNGFTVHATSLALQEEDLTSYQIIVLGNPLDSKFSSTEVSTIKGFVEAGGGLLVLSGATIFGKGGDAARNSNLNAILKPYALEFSDTAIGTALSQKGEKETTSDDMIAAFPAAQHQIVRGISHMLFTSATSVISVEKAHQLLRVSNHPGSPLVAAATEVNQGRVLALGGTTPFFDDYIETEDHSTFIVQAFRWLAGATTQQELVSLNFKAVKDDADPSSTAIEELRAQLNFIEGELHTLKRVIHSSLEEMEKVVRQIKEGEKESEEDT
ncbi:MAG: hypothetical protein Q6361_09070 [Candidatus Hermodarchaeota archaeon]|nr:hypothetical protein [Candidatus Hermodarchaeota archaeon]